MDDIGEKALESERIKAGKYPACGKDIKDKGSYLRCTECSWNLTHGFYNQENGYVVHYDDSGAVLRTEGL